MSELLLLIGAGIFLLISVVVWRKQVKREPRSLQQSFEEFMAAERKRRTEKG